MGGINDARPLGGRPEQWSESIGFNAGVIERDVQMFSTLSLDHEHTAAD